MSELQVLNFEENEVRAILIDGVTWWVAKDICSLLDLSDVSMSLQRLNNNEKLLQSLHVSGQNRQISLISESGLYKLIFKSRKPKAEKFITWITSDVLPQIRKTGTYRVQDSYMIDDPVTRATRWIEEAKVLIAIQLELKMKTEYIEEKSAAIALAEKCLDASNTYSIEEVSKHFDIGMLKMFGALRTLEILKPSNLPYQGYIDSGYFKVISKTYKEKDTDRVNMYHQTRVTPLGLAWIARNIRKIHDSIPSTYPRINNRLVSNVETIDISDVL